MAKRRSSQKPTKQSVVRYHSDWLRLIERSGPFLSLPVLLDTFPNGPSADDRDRRVQLKQAYESWQSENRDIAVHRAWIEYVLTHGLEIPKDHLVDTGHIPQNLSVRVDVHHETLTPDIALIEPEDTEDNTPPLPRMLVMIVPPDQALDKKIPGKNWVASPQTRMADLVRGCNDQGITFGLLTNGEQWMLVYSKQGETASFTTWYASIWFDEKITLRAFRDLLSARRFYGDPDRTLDKLFERSADDQHEVTDQLGLQVRDAIETLVSAIDEIDRDRKRKLLAGFSEEQLYEACVTVMMRLVFLFFAEERRLLPVKESFYEQNYSLHTLFERLQTQKNMGEEELEWAYSGWCRLLALFRAIHGGVQHDDMQLHAYGSSLFDPDRFPFLEGRPQDTKWRELESQPLPINDRTLLHVLEALKLLEVRGIGGGHRITRVMSFRELDVEDIGHIYESLLDHTAKRAKGHVLGIVGSKGKEPELALDELEKQAKQSREDLVEYLKDETGKTPKSIEKLLDAETKIDESRLLAACGNDQAFAAQVKPFANLVRENRSGDPIIIPDGSVYVTEGTDRRSSGTHYTPKSLTEPIVQYTLEPLVYEGPAEGKPQDEWKLKTPAEILELNICDMACGSGAFLVQACRYMAERLVEAWEHIEQTTEAPTDDSQTETGNTVVGTIEADQLVVEKSGKYATNKTIRRPRITPLGEISKNDPSEELIPLDSTERMVYARRIVADRCLYGVDKNPLATEMAKLSLWLLTLARDKPFTFLNHALRTGDSLVGVRSIEQLLRFALNGDHDIRPLMEKQREQIEKRIDAVKILRRQIESFPSNSSHDIERKTRMMENVANQTHRLSFAADRLLVESWEPLTNAARESALNSAIADVVFKFRDLPTNQLNAETKKNLDQAGIHSRFHWCLEFPEIVDRGGFDAFVGNPPFMGGSKITGSFGDNYRAYLVENISAKKGNADLVAYFFLRAGQLTARKGTIGLLSTKTISQGDTREVGLDQLVNVHDLYVVFDKVRWPGQAAVIVSQLHLYKGTWNGLRSINDLTVDRISAFLSDEEDGIPFKLTANQGCSFTGNKLTGMGFIVDSEKAKTMLDSNSGYASVVFRYLNGSDLNGSPTQLPSRWCINFWDWSEADAKKFPKAYDQVKALVRPKRIHLKRKRLRDNWWLHEEKRPAMYHALGRGKFFKKHPKGIWPDQPRDKVLVITQATKHLSFSFVNNDFLIDQACIAFPYTRYHLFALLISSIHEIWVRKYSSTLGASTLYYTPSDVFETFPFPDGLDPQQQDVISPRLKSLEKLGEEYHVSRAEIMRQGKFGLTDFYNSFHSPECKDSEFEGMREVKTRIDQLVIASYGWDDLELDHGFRDSKFLPDNDCTRFSITDPARKKIISRLLKLNHIRKKSEDLQSTETSNRRTKLRKSRKSTAAAGLLFDDEG